MKILLKNYCAFVTFNERSSSEDAMNNLFNKFTIKGEKYKLQWGKSLKTNFEEEENENKNNLKDINYKTEAPINNPLGENNILSLAENIPNNNPSYNNIQTSTGNKKSNKQIYNYNLNAFETGKKPYYPSMDPNLMVIIFFF